MKYCSNRSDLRTDITGIQTNQVLCDPNKQQQQKYIQKQKNPLKQLM